MSVSADQVAAYYDIFLHDRMLNYRIKPNARIERAVEFFCSSIRSGDVVLDIGCGIGIASEVMAKRARRVVGVDISEQNIWYASQTVRERNVLFCCADVIDDREKVEQALQNVKAKVDIFTLCDVIEHIRDEDRSSLFSTMARLGSQNAIILMTFPTEFYQQYLAREAPNELQIVDNFISPQLIAAEAAKVGFYISYFKIVDVWRKSQYAHCKLERIDSLNKYVGEPVEAPTFTRWIRTTRSSLRRPYERFLRKKYITDIFASK
jgi:2-polyprenyl-3-methyl-5-hydroxy-6-metoxy-1,4-benzoquinol methylase